MTVLQESPFDLIQNDLVQSRAQAANENGWGDLSEINIEGGNIQTIPHQMIAPTRDSATTVNQLVVNWIGLEGDSTGSSTIDSYNLQWDKSTNAVSWWDLTGDGDLPYDTALTGSFTDDVVPGT